MEDRKEVLRGISNIVFDFGCVLVDLDKERCVQAWHAIGAGPIAAYVDECRQEDLFHDLETGRLSVAGFCREVRRKCPACKADDDQIVWAWNQLLAGIPQARVERLHRLARHYRLYLLSNTNAIHWETCRRQLSGCFLREFLSYEMGTVKPSPDIFERMLSEVGIQPEETLFIDDSPANCHTARLLGLRTLCVENGDQWAALV